MVRHTAIAMSLLVLSGSVAWAQLTGLEAAAVAPFAGAGYWWGGGFSSTPAEGYARGWADVIRAQGDYNRATSEAMVNFEDARTKYIDNRSKWTQTYFAMKERNQAQTAERRERNRISPETLAAAARSAAPPLLGPDALDPVSGQIHWPNVLLEDEYAGPRRELDQLFELHARTSGAAATVSRIHELTREMTAILKSRITELPPGEYIQARKFLDSLAYTASRTG